MKKEKITHSCEPCRIKKRKCNGFLPCGTCIRSRKGGENCSYKQGRPKPRPINIDNSPPVAAQLKQTKLESIINSTSQFMETTIFGGTGNTLFDPQHLLSSQNQFLSQFDFEKFSLGIATPMEDHIFFSSPSVELQKNDLEDHLIRLNHLSFFGISCREDLACVSLYHRKTPFSAKLRKVMCYYACFFSNHPDLFKTVPTYQERVNAAKKYDIENERGTMFVDMDPLNVIGYCDDIRALLKHARHIYDVGSNSMSSISLISQAYHLARFVGLLEPSIFNSYTKKRSMAFHDFYR
jgi:hypothetical protein